MSILTHSDAVYLKKKNPIVSLKKKAYKLNSQGVGELIKLAIIIISGISNFIIYWALLNTSPFFLLALFMNVDENKAMVIFMFLGLTIVPLVSAWLAGVTTKRINKLNRQKKFIIIPVQSLLAICISIFLFKG